MEDRVLHNDPLSGLKHIKNICRNTRRKNVNFKKLMMIIGKIEKVATQTIIEDKKNNPESESLIEIKSLLMRLTTTIDQLVKNKKEEKVMEEEKDKEKSRKLNLMAQPFIRKKDVNETKKSTIRKENEMKEKLGEKKEKEELQQLNLMTQSFTKKKVINETEETEKTIIRNENERKNEEKEIEENEKIAETSNEENEISYEAMGNYNDMTEESIKESDEETKENNETKENDEEIIKKCDETPPVIITSAIDDEVERIMEQLKIEKEIQEKIFQINHVENMCDCRGDDVIIDHIEIINKEDIKDVIEDDEIKEKEDLEKIDHIRHELLKKLKLKTDGEIDTIFGIISILY